MMISILHLLLFLCQCISVKDIYADEDLEKLRDDCKELRNLAIIDILYSTGMWQRR